MIGPAVLPSGCGRCSSSLSDACGAMRRIFRKVVALFGVALVVAVGLFAIDEFWRDIPELTDCNTTLCCETCENIPVTRGSLTVTRSSPVRSE